MPKKLPDDLLTAISWLKTIPGIPANRVSTKLGDVSMIYPDGFVTVRVVGGSVNPELPRSSPVIQVLTWACDPDGDRQDPPWAEASQLQQIIRMYCWDNQYNFKGVIPTQDDYYDVCVQSAMPLTIPNKVPSDDARMACYSMDVLINWTMRRD